MTVLKQHSMLIRTADFLRFPNMADVPTKGTKYVNAMIVISTSMIVISTSMTIIA